MHIGKITSEKLIGLSVNFVDEIVKKSYNFSKVIIFRLKTFYFTIHYGVLLIILGN